MYQRPPPPESLEGLASSTEMTDHRRATGDDGPRALGLEGPVDGAQGQLLQRSANEPLQAEQEPVASIADELGIDPDRAEGLLR